MKPIEEKYFEYLRDAGLYVSKPFGEEHVLGYGVIVGKPNTTKGNCVPNYSTGCGDIEMDAPTLYFYHAGTEWIVHLQEGVPTFIPGDFLHSWNTPEEALDDIIDFYLGKPERMALKAERWQKVCERSSKTESP